MKNENCTLDQVRELKKNRLILNLNNTELNLDINFAYSYIEQVYDGEVTNIDRGTLARYFDRKRKYCEVGRRK